MRPQTPVSELPHFPPRPDGVDDHSFLADAMKLGPLVRDGLGNVHCFTKAHFDTVMRGQVTRQVETEFVRLRGVNSGPIFEFFDMSLLFSNGKRHVARRRPLARTFAFPVMRALRGEIRVAADALIAPLAGKGRVDFLTEVAGPLPAGVIGRILGVPAGDTAYFANLVYSAIRILGVRSEDVMAQAGADTQELNTYVAGLMAERRARPTDDFLSRLLADTGDGSLNDDEIRTQIVTLIFAGSDTTRATLAMGFARLLEHPEQWAAFKADPDNVKAAAVEEILRFDPVVASLPRIARVPFELAGTKIVPGTPVLPSLLRILRDPEVYANPEAFDISRNDHPRHTPGFGAGAHRCLGEALARVELEEALSSLARHWPAAKVAGPMPQLRGLGGTRGISALQIAPGT